MYHSFFILKMRSQNYAQNTLLYNPPISQEAPKVNNSLLLKQNPVTHENYIELYIRNIVPKLLQKYNRNQKFSSPFDILHYLKICFQQVWVSSHKRKPIIPKSMIGFLAQKERLARLCLAFASRTTDYVRLRRGSSSLSYSLQQKTTHLVRRMDLLSTSIIDFVPLPSCGAQNCLLAFRFAQF